MKLPTTFTVRLPGPIDVATSLEFFGRNGDDRIDRWDGTTLVRTLPVRGTIIAYTARLDATVAEPTFIVTVNDPAHCAAVEDALRATFVAPPLAAATLAREDRIVARLAAIHPGLRPVIQFDLLAALVRCISAQQVNLRWATTTRGRLAEAFGTRHEVAGEVVYSLDPATLAALSPGEIRALQFTTRKAEYIVAAAEAIASGRLHLDTLATLPDDDVIARLTALRGIGLWTSEWILARTLGRPRVVAGDLGVRKAVGMAYLGTPLPPEPEVRRATAHWGVSALFAQNLLLHGLGSGTLAI